MSQAYELANQILHHNPADYSPYEYDLARAVVEMHDLLAEIAEATEDVPLVVRMLLTPAQWARVRAYKPTAEAR